MTEQTARPDWRDRVMTHPDMILEDRDLMRALLAANERQMGKNVVDMRGIAMERLEARLERLEDTHRNVIAAAYENLAGTNQVHRCVLKLLECGGLRSMLDMLAGDVADILRIEHIRLVLESRQPAPPPHPAISPVEAGFCAAYVRLGRDAPVRRVTLRQCNAASEKVFGDAADDLRSEALLTLDLGEGRLPGMLVLASEDPQQFRANQGIDLLAFFTGVVERMLRAKLG
ncbi:MAG: DUF484 family protein [Pseudomonadota bacterium]